MVCVCGTEFAPKTRRHVFCSATCRYRARGDVPMGTIVEQTCLTCDAPFSYCRSKRPRLRCDRCREAHKDAQRSHSGRAKRMRLGLLTGDVEVVTRQEIFQRDNWECWICGAPVLKDTHRLDPLGASVDHIAPLSKGGGWTSENLRTAHRSCNLLRGDGNRPAGKRKPKMPRSPGREGSAWRKVRAAVLASSSTCHLCGKAVDFGAKPCTPIAPSVDHLFPLKILRALPVEEQRRISLNPAFLRVAHFGCNSRRGAKRLAASRRTASSRSW